MFKSKLIFQSDIVIIMRSVFEMIFPKVSLYAYVTFLLSCGAVSGYKAFLKVKAIQSIPQLPDFSCESLVQKNPW